MYGIHLIIIIIITVGFIRQLLGVNKKSTNLAVLSETGKYPICIKIFSQIIKYWERLKKGEVSVLLKATADLNKIDKLSNKQSWLRIVEYLVKYTKITEGSGPDCSTNLTNVFKTSSSVRQFILVKTYSIRKNQKQILNNFNNS